MCSFCRVRDGLEARNLGESSEGRLSFDQQDDASVTASSCSDDENSEFDDLELNHTSSHKRKRRRSKVRRFIIYIKPSDIIIGFLYSQWPDFRAQRIKRIAVS